MVPLCLHRRTALFVVALAAAGLLWLAGSSAWAAPLLGPRSQAAVTPAPADLAAPVSAALDSAGVPYVDRTLGFTMTVPAAWRITPALRGERGGVTSFMSFAPGSLPSLEEIPPSEIKIDVGRASRVLALQMDLREWVAAGEGDGVTRSVVAEGEQSGYRYAEVDVRGDNGRYTKMWYLAAGESVLFAAVMPGDSTQIDLARSAILSMRLAAGDAGPSAGLPAFAPGPSAAEPHAVDAPARFRLPFDGTRIISEGPGCGESHGGKGYEASAEATDYAIPEGQTIRAAQSGKIIYAQWNDQGFGNLVKVEHEDGTVSFYAHLKSISVSTRSPDNLITRGTPVGLSGNTGHSTGPHLHFEVRSGGQSIPIRDLYMTTWYNHNPASPCIDGNDGEATFYYAFNDGPVTLYQDPGYGGESFVVNDPGTYDMTASMNDAVSSLRVDYNWSVRLYEHATFDARGRGSCVVLDGDRNDFNGLSLSGAGGTVGADNQVSSMDVAYNVCFQPCGSAAPPVDAPGAAAQPDWPAAAPAGSCSGPTPPPPPPPPPPTDRVRLYAKANYEDEIASYDSEGFTNDPARNSFSLKIPSGWSVETWSQDNRGGDYSCWAASVANLQDHGWHLKIDSMAVYKRNVCGSQPPTGQWSAMYWRTRTCYDDHSQCQGSGSTYDTTYNVPGTVDGRNYIIRQDWGQNSPGSSTPLDNWTGRYIATIDFSPGYYVFYSTHDDGLKLKLGNYGEYQTSDSRVDNDRLCNGNGQGYYLSGSTRVEAYLHEGGGDATIQIWYDTNTEACAPPDPPALYRPQPNEVLSDRTPSFAWTGSSGATKYRLEVSTAADFSRQVVALDLTADTYEPTAPLGFGAIYWRVRAQNRYGNWSDWSTSSAFIAPPAPANVTASDGTYPDRIAVQWSGVAGAESYEVYRAATYSGTKEKLGATAATAYDDATAAYGAIYYYWIKACAPGVCSDFSIYDVGRKRPPEPIACSDESLYFDDFGSPTTGWFTDTSDRFWGGYFEGEYRMLHRTSGQMVWEFPPSTFTNYVIRADVHQAGAVGGAFGLVFGVDPTDAFKHYVFELRGSDYRLRARTGSDWAELLSWRTSSFINQGGAVNHLEVHRKDRQIDLFVNGHYLTSVIDARFLGARQVGIYSASVDNDPANIDVRFDDFRVTGCDGAAANLLANGGFEEGTTAPLGWEIDAWNYSASQLSRDTAVKQSGNASAKIASPQANGAAWIRTLALLPGAEYRLSGCIRTSNVAASGDAANAGANVSLRDGGTRSAGVFGTADWTCVGVQFNTGTETEVKAAARLGMYSGLTTGTAWFDDLRVEQLGGPHLDCHALTLTHTGSGGDPVAKPANSPGCPPSKFVAGQTIALTASPANGWRVARWSGTASDGSMAAQNTLTMPDRDHTVRVDYEVGSPICIPAAKQVSLYAGINYTGACQTYEVGVYSGSGLGAIANDNASSIRVGAGARARLCRDSQLGGVCEYFTADDAGLADNAIGDNNVSSLKVELWSGEQAVSAVAASSALPRWEAGRLVDGNTSTAYSSAGHTEHLASSEWAAVVLPAPASVNRIRLFPRYVGSAPALGFPKDFVIQYSRNGDGRTCDPARQEFTQLSNWTPLVSRFGFPQPAGGFVDFEVPPSSLQCVRVLGTELSQDDYGARYLQLGEIQLYSANGRERPVSAFASSALSTWPASRLIDENAYTAYSSVGHTEHLASGEWVALVMPGRRNVDQIVIRPRFAADGSALGFPKDFVLQYSWNGDGHTCDPAQPDFTRLSNWLPLVSRFGYPQPVNSWAVFTFAPHAAECVRLLGTELSQDDYGARYLQLNEVALWAGTTGQPISGVVASSALPRWEAAKLVDGNLESSYSSLGHMEHLTSSEWAAVVFPARTDIRRIRLYPRYVNGAPALGFPKDFVFQYSWNGDGRTCDPARQEFTQLSNWLPLVSRFGYAQPEKDWLQFEFGVRAAGCVRVLGTELSQDDYGARYLQLGEVTVY